MTQDSCPAAGQAAPTELVQTEHPVPGAASGASAAGAKGPRKTRPGSAGLPGPPPGEGHWEDQQQPARTSTGDLRNHRAGDNETALWLSLLSSSQPLVPSFSTFSDQERHKVLEIPADYGFTQ